MSLLSEYSNTTSVLRAKYQQGFVAALRASYDSFLAGITVRCFTVWAEFTMLLSLVISLKLWADIQLSMSSSQAKIQTCVSEEERMVGNNSLVCTVRTWRIEECVTEQRCLL